MSSVSEPLARRLAAGDPSAATELKRVCAGLGIGMLPDHEGAMFAGAFKARRAVPRAQYLELARSWERFDRAFKPAPSHVADLALERLGEFVAKTGVAGDLGDHILFVVVVADEDVVVSLGAESWDEWLVVLGRARDDGGASASLRELLRRDPRLLEPPPAPDR